LAGTEILDRIKARLDEKIPGAVLKAEQAYDFPVFTIDAVHIHDALRLLRDDQSLGFHFLTDLTGYQTPDEKQLVAVYHLHNMPENVRVRVKTFFPISEPEIPTASDLWAAADWMERETYDFFGIRFKGHPNLKRILNVDEMDIFPLRKEYPLEDQTRDDKSDAKFGR
jgi:NADH-quinone oxidoreductase subunit C